MILTDKEQIIISFLYSRDVKLVEWCGLYLHTLFLRDQTTLQDLNNDIIDATEDSDGPFFIKKKGEVVEFLKINAFEARFFVFHPNLTVRLFLEIECFGLASRGRQNGA